MDDEISENGADTLHAARKHRQPPPPPCRGRLTDAGLSPVADPCNVA